jgi:putative transport protein
MKLSPEVLHFAREAGLVLFVYAIGAEAGPGFIASLRRNGLTLNLLAVSTVILGCVVLVIVGKLTGVKMPVLAGIYSGSVTNTPSLAAATQVLADMGKPVDLPGLGYAMAYPGGVFGIIAVMLLTRAMLGSRAVQTEASAGPVGHLLGTLNIEVTSPDCVGRTLSEILQRSGSGVAVSRHRSKGEIRAGSPESVLSIGDVLLAVGQQQDLDSFCASVGRASSTDLRTHASELSVRRVLVTRRQAQERIGDVLAELRGANATRIQRSGIEFTPSPELRLQFGDIVQIVGEPEGIQQAIDILGNTTRQLDHPQLIPLGVGIALGVLLGSMPISVPGIPVPIKLGLAGGPLIAAMVLSRIGRIGSVVWYLPRSANFLMREMGIAIFLATVGLKSGEHFAETLRGGDGFLWMGCGLAVTVIPLLILTLVSSFILRLNFMTTCGLLAGSMTDPPALSFASSLGSAEQAYISYAAVYPLVMITRVVSAQLLVIWLTS